VRLDYMQTPEIRSQVRPAFSHPLFVVYDRGAAPEYADCSRAPSDEPHEDETMVTALMGVPFCEESRSNLRALRDRPRCLVKATLRRLGEARRLPQASGSPRTAGGCLRPSETV